MDAIKSYIDHMFKALPATADVKRAKTDLMQMSEDRYQELRDSGVSEHEDPVLPRSAGGAGSSTRVDAGPRAGRVARPTPRRPVRRRS